MKRDYLQTILWILIIACLLVAALCSCSKSNTDCTKRTTTLHIYYTTDAESYQFYNIETGKTYSYNNTNRVADTVEIPVGRYRVDALVSYPKNIYHYYLSGSSLDMIELLGNTDRISAWSMITISQPYDINITICSH